jgi:hypothetical protein
MGSGIYKGQIKVEWGIKTTYCDKKNNKPNRRKKTNIFQRFLNYLGRNPQTLNQLLGVVRDYAPLITIIFEHCLHN